MIIYMNAQSLVGKVNELSCSLSDMDLDLILMTKTWCNREITDSFLSISGYEVQTDLRTDGANTGGGRGGGLLVYVKNGVKVFKLYIEPYHLQIYK